MYSSGKQKKRKSVKQKLKDFVDPKTGKRKESSIEKKFRLWLERRGIPHQPEKFLQWQGKWKSYDFLISDGVNYTFLVELDGWFHGLDKKGKEISTGGLNKIQKKNKKNDKFKNELADHFGIPLLRIKESDIHKRFKQVEIIILNEIKRQQGFDFK